MRRASRLIAAVLLLSTPLPDANGGDQLPAFIEGAIHRYLEAEWGIGNFRWEAVSADRNFVLPPGAEIEVEGKCKPRGKTIVQLKVLQNGKLIRRIPVGLEIRAFALAPVSNMRLARHTVIDGTNFRFERVEVTSTGGKWPENMRELTQGIWWTRRKIEAGNILRWNDLEKRPAVLRGDHVLLVAKNNGVTISAAGIALQNGGIGQRIRVENKTNGTMLIGEIESRATVRVKGRAGRLKG